ncbi:MAG TPA: redox-regulated ATPase YchF [Thermoplasmata archaeon]|nr:redox-regulated ATPase YchF [Thermoplasmata archaeon]
MVEIGLVGKPNVGKSTMFVAMTLHTVPIAPYPFTTIEPNKGVGFVRAKCPHPEKGAACAPRNSQCVGGTRLIPITLIDVAGLVPGAHEGRGMGNKFLDDLRQADALIQVVDASGATDAEGNPCEPGAYDPLQEIEFLEDEIARWIAAILDRNWEREVKRLHLESKKIDRFIAERLAGLGVKEPMVHAAMRAAGLSTDASTWSKEDIVKFARSVREASKPIKIAANKADLAGEEMKKRLVEEGGALCAAEYERALRLAAQKGLVDYVPGASSFKVSKPESLNDAQRGALKKIDEYFSRAGGTGVQQVLESVAYDTLDLIPVYPVEDETHWTDKQGALLPDAHLVPKGTTARDLAFRVHTDLGQNFIRALDARTKRALGADHALAAGDVVKIVAKV